MPMKPTITALTITLNGERTLSRCLDSFSFCDAILVVDSFSSDKTEEIARSRDAFFITHAFEGYYQQIRFGIDWLNKNAPTDWIVFVDCDEICSDELRESILAAVKSPEGKTSFSVSRATWYYDRFLRHGDAYPDRLFRIFTPDGIRLDEFHGHPTYTPKGKSGELKGDLLHYSDSGFFHHMEKLNIYAQRGAESMRAAGKKGGLFRALFHSTWRFINEYVIKRGFLDGKAGFIYAMHNAWYTFLKYIRLDEGNWDVPPAKA